VEFEPDPRDRRRNLILTVLIGVPVVALALIGGTVWIRSQNDELLNRDVLVIVFWVVGGVATVVATARFWREARARGIVLQVAPDAMTLTFGGSRTRIPWSDAAAVAVARGGWLMIKPGPGLTVRGRWEQWWLARAIFGWAGSFYAYPRWSSGIRGWVDVVNVKWFPAADRERLTDLVTRYANA
jgi:hypothetical protein